MLTRSGLLNIIISPVGANGYDDLRRKAVREPLGFGVRTTLASIDDIIRTTAAHGGKNAEARLLRLRLLDLALEEHPFARQDVYVDGRELFIRADEDVAETGARSRRSRPGQRVFAPAVEDFLRSIDWRTGKETPYRWRPPEGDDEVTLNPEVEYGLPAVRRVRTETILHRFLARESAEEIAGDFGLEVGKATPTPARSVRLSPRTSQLVRLDA
jgi:hypothetical protein